MRMFRETQDQAEKAGQALSSAKAQFFSEVTTSAQELGFNRREALVMASDALTEGWDTVQYDA